MNDLNDTSFTVTYVGNIEAPGDKVYLEIIPFQNQKKLRSHTLKHLLNETEFSNTWKEFTKLTVTDISKAHTFLDQIQCPAKVMSSQACETACPVYGQCTYMIDVFEREYCNIIESIVKDSVKKPLFSIFISTETSGHFLVCLSSSSIVAKAAKTRGNKFNLATCYANNVSGECYIEFRNRNITKIRNEAATESTKWYSMETWGLVKKVSTKSKKKKIKHTPYRRGGAGNYRQYLDDAFD